MASINSLTLTVKLRWWVRPYLATLFLMCDTFDCEPDIEKVTRVVMCGVVLTPNV